MNKTSLTRLSDGDLITVSGDTCQTLELAQDLLRHAVPSGDPAEVVARALKLLVEDLVKRKFSRSPIGRGRGGGPRAIHRSRLRK